MTDIVPELKKKIDKAYQDLIEHDEVLSGLTAKISESGTWDDAQMYAGRIAAHRSNSLLDNIKVEDLPNGQMYYNIANRIIPPALRSDYDRVAEICMQVQEQVNEAARIGIKAQKPELNEDRIDGIVNRISSEPYNDVKWLLDAPIDNFLRSAVDDTVKANADFHYKSGLNPVIKRTTDGKCCDWCSKRAGTYPYKPDMDREVFRRHENCGCTVAYYPDVNSKRRQNVWDKQWAETSAPNNKFESLGSYPGNGFGDENGKNPKAKDDELKRKIAELLHPQKDPSKITLYGRTIETSELSLDNEHTNEEREHGVSLEEAKSFIESACFSVSVWNGVFEKYYSDEGASYVLFGKMIIRTSFKKDEYDEAIQKALEVFHEYKK